MQSNKKLHDTRKIDLLYKTNGKNENLPKDEIDQGIW